MLNDKPLIKENLDEFFKAVREIVLPYFSQFGYKGKVLRGRSIVLFEKRIGDKYISSVDYFCYAKYGMNAFRVTFNSVYKYLYTLSENEIEKDDIPWKYQDSENLREKLSETIKKIKKQELLEIIDYELTKKGNARVTDTENL